MTVSVCLFPKVIFSYFRKWFFSGGSGYFVFYISRSHFKTFSSFFLFYSWPEVIICLLIYVFRKVIFFSWQEVVSKLFLEVFFFYLWPEVIIYLFPKVIFLYLRKWLFFMTGSGYFVFYISGRDFRTFSRSFLFYSWPEVIICLFMYLFPKVIFVMTGSGYFVFYFPRSNL